MKGFGCQAKKFRLNPASDKEPRKYFWVEMCLESFDVGEELQQRMYNVSMIPSVPVCLPYKLLTNPQ